MVATWRWYLSGWWHIDLQNDAYTCTVLYSGVQCSDRLCQSVTDTKPVHTSTGGLQQCWQCCDQWHHEWRPWEQPQWWPAVRSETSDQPVSSPCSTHLCPVKVCHKLVSLIPEVNSSLCISSPRPYSTLTGLQSTDSTDTTLTCSDTIKRNQRESSKRRKPLIIMVLHLKGSPRPH